MSYCEQCSKLIEEKSDLQRKLEEAEKEVKHLQKMGMMVSPDQHDLRRLRELEQLLKEVGFGGLQERISDLESKLRKAEEVVVAAKKVVPGYLKKEKVDIKTLEEILKKEGSANVHINPDGSITASPEMEALRSSLASYEGKDGEGND